MFPFRALPPVGPALNYSSTGLSRGPKSSLFIVLQNRYIGVFNSSLATRWGRGGVEMTTDLLHGHRPDPNLPHMLLQLLQLLHKILIGYICSHHTNKPQLMSSSFPFPN